MQHIRQTLEILRTKIWQIDPRFASSVRPVVRACLSGDGESMVSQASRQGSGWFALRSEGYVRRHPSLSAQGPVLTDDPERDTSSSWWEDEGPLISPDDEFIDVIDMTGSVTRYGGWCSQGSVEQRDQMIYASRCPNCIGHLFVIDTPGGSAFSMNDYQQGIEAAHRAGQPVISWIDGMCCSAGVAAACQTDEIYVQHANDEVGCIGTMACFYTLADGTSDDDGYVYHEIYDPESFDKNLEHRELANNGNAAPYLQDLASCGREFREMVRSCRPAVREDMLHGRIYKASELMGILVDGVMTFEECVSRIEELHSGVPPLRHDKAVLPAQTEPDVTDTDNTNQKDKTEMIQYEHINKALGFSEGEVMAVREDGGFDCHAAYAQKIDDAFATAERQALNVEACTEALLLANSNIKADADRQSELQQQLQQRDDEITALKAEVENLGGMVAEQEEAITAARSRESDLEHQLQERESEIAALKASEAAKEAEAEQLSHETTPSPVPAPAKPEEKKAGRMTAHIYDSSMSVEERARAFNERMAYLRRKG